MCRERADGMWWAFEAALIVARQNGKGGVLECRALAGLFVYGERMVLWTAHEFKTCKAAYERLRDLIQSAPDLDRLVAHWKFSNAEVSIELHDGRKIQFIARSQKSGRGLTADCLILDEAMFLTAAHLSALMPTLATSANPQIIYAGSAGLSTSRVWWALRKRALSADPGRLVWCEWTAEDIEIVDGKVRTSSPDPGDREAWIAANPAMGIRIDEEFIASEMRALESEIAEFLRERLGVWDPLDEDANARVAKLPADKWAGTAGPDLPRSVPMVALTFDVTKDGAWSSIAWSAGDLSAPYVEVMHHKPGTGWVPHELVAQVVKHKPSIVACNGAGPAGALVGPVLQAFKAAGLSTELVQMDARAYTQACGGFYSDVVEGRLRRPRDQDPLNIAAGDATERLLGDAWVWDRRSAVAPISPLVAVTIARAFLPTEQPVDLLANIH